MLRLWLIFCVAVAVVSGSVQAGLLGFGRGGGSTPITDIDFSGPAIKYNVANPSNWVIGDTWYNTWADDGLVYITANDMQINTWSPHQHIGMFTLQGWDASAILTRLPSNTLGGLWGNSSQPLVNNEGFKSGGLICLPAAVSPVTSVGKFYLVTRMIDQLAWRWFSNTQIIKSHDHGVTWTPTPTAVNQPYNPAMWPGVIGAGMFFQYGKCYEGAGPHRSNEFVYAGIENNSFGHMAESAVEEVHLGRVPINKIDDLNVADWQYYQGGDGMRNESWSGNLFTAVKILNGPSYGAQYEVGTHYGGFQYLPAYKQYVYIGQRNLFGRPTTSINFFAAPAPWGPWTLYRQVISEPAKEAWQNVIQPSIVNGGESFTVATSGDPLVQCCNPATTPYQPMFRPVQVTGRPFLGN